MDKKIIYLKNQKNNFETNDNLALKNELLDDTALIIPKKSSKYTKPKVKKLTFEKNNPKIVMGCWQQSYTSNGGDGC